MTFGATQRCRPLAAVSCLNYYFIPPIFSFENSPSNWVALGAFEFTALVISRLSQSAQQRADEAMAGQRDTARLYTTSRRLLLLESTNEPADALVSMIREVFDLDGVELFDAFSGKVHRLGRLPDYCEQKLRNAYAGGTDSFDAGARSWYCMLSLGKTSGGMLALHNTEITGLAAAAIASLAGSTLEHFRAQERESSAQAARETEQLRTAVLDALAHQIKSPLTVTRTASSGLLALGGLSDIQRELVTTIDQQTKKLADLATELLVAPDVSRSSPKLEPVLLSHLAGIAISRLPTKADRDRFIVSTLPAECAVLADPELLVICIGQLLDNALKYSESGSHVDIRMVPAGLNLTLEVRSKGPIITQANRQRIFERFYRATEAKHLSVGTGLGLSIVKQIVDAHHGRAWAEEIHNYGTSFLISLPLAAAARNTNGSSGTCLNR